MDQETVKITALKTIFDLLHFFGLEAFKLEMAQEDDKTTGPDTSVKVADVSDQLDDFDDLHSENSSQPPQQQDATDIGADILTILTDLLDSNVRQLLVMIIIIFYVPSSIVCSSLKCIQRKVDIYCEQLWDTHRYLVIAVYSVMLIEISKSFCILKRPTSNWSSICQV